MSNGDSSGSDKSERPQRTEIEAAYAASGQLVTGQDQAHLLLPGNLRREPVEFNARIKDPLLLREALTAMHTVVGSDYRYVPKDRSGYAAYMRLRRESSGPSAWKAQQAYFDWLLKNDPLGWCMLDPVITVHPDKVLLEVFSKDEGVYAKLAIDRGAFEVEGEPVCGVTSIDFSQALFEGVSQMRSYRDTHINIGQQAVKLATAAAGEVIQKNINTPDSWLRGFLQVQSSATLPSTRFDMQPIDFYNMLRHLRMHGDKKGKRRGLRVELTPGEKPVIVLEPWETVIRTSGSQYTGAAQVVRIWGRRRLMLARRLLPFVESVEAHLLGAGLPSFWVLRMPGASLTLGLTGFTAANWSRAVSFDLMLPRNTQSAEPLQKVVEHLHARWFDTAASIGAATGLQGGQLVETLQKGCQQGLLMYDLAEDCYRLRPLTAEPLDLDRLEYRNNREKHAHDLLGRQQAVEITDENRIFNTGVELTGKVVVSEDRREYRPQILIADEGHVSRAECTCSFYRQQKLKHGPCSCLIALRLAYSIELKKRGEGGAGRAVTTETRVFSKRKGDIEHVYQLTLDAQRLRIRWGQAGCEMRLQNLRFNDIAQAKIAYQQRADSLAEKGYLDQAAG